MQALHIQAVTTARHQRLFLELPGMIHAHDPNWAPHLQFDEQRLLGFVKGHPFPAENSVQCWLAYRGEVPVGRIAAIKHHTAQASATTAAQFGFFTAQNDPQVCQALVKLAAQWACQQGLRTLQGPLSPSINYAVGMLQSGFQQPPSFQIPCNPSYYPQLMEQVGMQPVQDLFALELDGQNLPRAADRLERVAACIAKRYRVQFRSLSRWNATRDLHLFLSIAQRSLQSHWGFTPLSAAERQQLVTDMKHIVVPELLQFAEIDGVAVGAALALPDFAPCLRKMKGKLLPLGFLKLWLARKNSARYRLVAANILPDYQRMGLAPALVGHITRHVINLGASSVEFSWIAQSNPLSFETIENGGAVRSKTMRIYQADCVDLLERLAGNAGSVLERPSPAENSSSQSAWANPPTVSVSD